MIDAATHKIVQTITSHVPGVLDTDRSSRSASTSRADGETAFVALGPANRVAVVDAKTYEVKKYLLVGPAGLARRVLAATKSSLYTANGISNDMSVIDVADLQGRRSRCRWASLPWGVVVGPVSGAIGPDRRPALEVAGLSHAFGKRAGAATMSAFAVRARRFHRAARAERRRQDHAVRARHPAVSQRAPGRIAVFGHDMRARAARPRWRGWAWCSSNRRSISTSRSRRTWTTTPRCTACRARWRAPRVAAELERVGLADRARRPRAPAVRRPAPARRTGARADARTRRCCCSTSRRSGSTSKAARSCSTHVRTLCAERGLGVLWATHLIDEADDESRVIVLHKGRVLARRPGAGRWSPRPAPATSARRVRQADQRAGASRGMTPGQLRALPRRHRPARGAALAPSARPLRLGAGAAAGLAGDLRRRLSFRARRLDHSAVRDLHSLRGLYRARPGRR